MRQEKEEGSSSKGTRDRSWLVGEFNVQAEKV